MDIYKIPETNYSVKIPLFLPEKHFSMYLYNLTKKSFKLCYNLKVGYKVKRVNKKLKRLK